MKLRNFSYKKVNFDATGEIWILGECISSVLLERILDLIIVFLFALAGTILLINYFTNLFWEVLIALIIILVGILVFMNKKLGKRFGKTFIKFLIPKKFKKDAIKPLLKSFSNQFNTLVIWSNSNFGYNDIYMSWEGIDNIDKQLEAKIHQIYLRYGVFTINMVLQQLGMEPVEWGDVPYLLNQMIPLQSKSKPSFPARKEDDDFDLKGWLSTGLTIGGIIPTGLERVEKTDMDLAIRKLLSDAKKKKIILV